MSDEAAAEIRSNLEVTRTRMADADGLKQAVRYMDADDWQNLRQQIESGRSPRSYRLGRFGPRVEETIDSLLRASPSFLEFEKSTQEAIARTIDAAAALRAQTLRNKIITFAGEEVLVPAYIKNLLHKFSEYKVLYLRERRALIGKEEAERLLALKMRRGGSEVLRNIQDTVTALLGVQIDAFSGSGEPQQTAEMDVDNFLVEANGSGIREALRLILGVELDNPNILFVEEPEMHLHPALERAMMRYLKRITSDLHLQVFVSTHSTNFLDTAEMQNVYLVSKIRATEVKLVNLEEATDHIPRELGMRLSSFFMFDRLMFIEGPSDEAIIREWASTLRINLSRANVGFIPIGGARNFAHFATQSTLSFLTKRQVETWFLIDRDEKDEPEIAKLQDMLGQNGKLYVLRKREIENYLLCPRAILELISLKKQTSGKRDQPQPTEDELMDATRAFLPPTILCNW
jgi:putative ATP-dependent endonuclease of OLD family